MHERRLARPRVIYFLAQVVFRSGMHENVSAQSHCIANRVSTVAALSDSTGLVTALSQSKHYRRDL